MKTRLAKSSGILQFSDNIYSFAISSLRISMNQFFNLDIGTLQRWLTWELSGSALFFLSFMHVYALYLMVPVILLFLPVLIGTLWLEKRFGWLIFFALFVITPAVTIYFVIDSGTWFFALQMIPFGLFFFYCFLLRLTVPMWAREQDKEPEPVPDFKL